jgi:hypothetical protein
MLSEEYKDFLNPLLPESWRNNHKISDTIDTLDSGAFEIIDEFIFELALFQIPFGETSQ